MKNWTLTSKFFSLAVALSFAVSACYPVKDRVPAPADVLKYKHTQEDENAKIDACREGENTGFSVLFKAKGYKKASYSVKAKNDIINRRMIGQRLRFTYDTTPRTKNQSENDTIHIVAVFVSKKSPEDSIRIDLQIKVSIGLWNAVKILKIDSTKEKLIRKPGTYK